MGAVYKKVVAHSVVTLRNVVIWFVIPISRMVVFTNLAVALQSVPDRVFIGYIGLLNKTE